MRYRMEVAGVALAYKNESKKELREIRDARVQNLVYELSGLTSVPAREIARALEGYYVITNLY